MLTEIDVSSHCDFLDGYLQQVMIEYQASNEELLVYLIDHNGKQDADPVVRIHLKVQDYVKLDNGAAFLGFC